MIGGVPLIDRSDSVLIVIDAQPGFSGATDAAAREAARSRAVAAWLVGVAAALDVPIVVTEEDPAANGSTDVSIAARLPPGTPILAKTIFGLAEEPAILAAVVASGRRTTVLVGAETDVCVAHSAVGLADRGFRVAVVQDATFSPGLMHEHGLAHLRDVGVEIRHAKGIYYDWVRTVAAARAFQADHPDLAAPPGFEP
jgi:nicotinamidase-related amidase